MGGKREGGREEKMKEGGDWTWLRFPPLTYANLSMHIYLRIF